MITQRHPADGYFEFTLIEEIVALRCHWPADLSNDEWIDIENRYGLGGYLQAVRDAISTGAGKTNGVTGGYLEITSLEDGFAIEFSRPQGGWSASSLRIRIKRPLAELLPHRDHSSESASLQFGEPAPGNRS